MIRKMIRTKIHEHFKGIIQDMEVRNIKHTIST